MTQAEDLRFRDNPEQHRFEARSGDQLAVAQYILSGLVIIFTHTEVPESLEGRGIGSALVRFALEDARARGLKVAPMCPFVAAYIRGHAGHLDLVTDQFRDRVTGDG